MKILTSLLFILSFVLFGSAQHYHPPLCTPMDWDFAMFSGNQIHGLWPQQCGECPSCGYPTYCRNVKYNSTILEYFEPYISEHWNSTLWEHEWLKHGSCTVWNEWEYFYHALQLSKCYPCYRTECLYEMKYPYCPT